MYQVSNDTILKKNKAAALFGKIEYRIADDIYILEIKSLKFNEVGEYCSK